MSSCFVTNVNEYLKNNCPERALEEDQQYFDTLFSLFYQDRKTIFTEGDNLPFQDLLSEMSRDERIGRYTSSKWFQLCSGVAFTSNRPDISITCGCFTNQRSCGKYCNSHAVPIFKVNDETVIVEPCFQNVCLIDGLQIELFRSSIGDIKISQLCTFCKSPSSCACRIENFDLVLDKSSSGGIGIDQTCHPDLSSITTVNGQDAREVYSSFFSRKERGNVSKTKAILIWILSSLLLIFIVILIIIGFRDTRKLRDYKNNKVNVSSTSGFS